MIKKILIFLHLFITVCIFISSCKKDADCENCIGGNRIPVVKAGADQWTQLPADSILLDGSASSDLDGKIISWSWRKVSGPDSYSIMRPADSISFVHRLIEGTYQFELTVKDNGGISAKDTVAVFVDDPRLPNRPPVARAGNDTAIALPGNSLVLDGSLSTDPDNNIATYHWTLIRGAGSFQIQGEHTVKAQVTELQAGAYFFKLQVSDSGGLSDMDTIQVNVYKTVEPTQQICGESGREVVKARLIPIGKLSQAKQFVSIGSAGGKILFAGGGDNQFNSKPEVDIYDIRSNTWSTAKLCVARFSIATISSGNKVFFAGGEVGDGTWPVDSVDIYDASSNTWSVAHLSKAGNNIAAAAVGNKVLFAGGDGGFSGGGRETRVDIFDLSAGKWSTASLSEVKRGFHAAVALDGKVYIAGGETWNGPTWMASSKVDIYDDATNSWSTSTLPEGKMDLTGIAVSGKIFWAGGTSGGYPSMYASCTVNIIDVNAGATTVSHLFRPAGWYNSYGQNAVLKNNRIIFFRHNEEDNRRFDIYDVSTGVWSIGEIELNLSRSSIISVNDEIYIAGGHINGVLSNQVWKLEF